VALQAVQDERAQTFATLTQEVTRISAELAASVTPTANLLRLARIEHLVKSADLSLRLLRDLAGADAALAAAQAELDPRVPLEAALQQSLRTDRAAIAEVVEPDMSALSAQWADTAQQIATLPWRAEPARASPSADSATAPAAGWRGVAAAIWQDLLHLVEIRNSTVADDVVLNPARETLVKAGLGTEIATLRYALAARDQRLARVCTATLKQALATHFEVTDPGVAAILAALTDLAALELAPVLPSLDASVHRLPNLYQRTSSAAPTAPPTENPAATTSEPMGSEPRDFM
jgi:uncharacterized protein HemX